MNADVCTSSNQLVVLKPAARRTVIADELGVDDALTPTAFRRDDPVEIHQAGAGLVGESGGRGFWQQVHLASMRRKSRSRLAPPLSEISWDLLS